MRKFFDELLAESYSPADAARIIAGSIGKRNVTLRANTLLSSRDEVASALDAAGIAWSGVTWYGDAFVLELARERDVWDLDVYREGKVYLQSLSSMIPALVLGAKAGEDVCDMCAAPGGKTTQIAALADGPEGGAYLTACEMHAPRAEKLEHNLAKLGARNVTVMRTDARRLDDFFSFDRVLVDAPCSGSGTLDLDDRRCAKRFTRALIAKSVKAQKALLAKGLSLLRPGGTLVYSTCSVLPCENDDIVEAALGNTPRGRTYDLQPVSLPGTESPAGPAGASGPASTSGAAGAASAAGPASVSSMAGVSRTTNAASAADVVAAVGAAGAAGPSGAASVASVAGVSGAAGVAGAAGTAALPILPTRLESTLCLCPTSLYEGFYIAQIRRLA